LLLTMLGGKQYTTQFLLYECKDAFLQNRTIS